MFAVMLQAAGTHLKEYPIGNIFDPRASPALAESHIGIFVISITAGIFLVVAGLLGYAMVRFRRRPEEGSIEPPQVYGSNQIEVAWTIIPILIVFVLLGVTARVIAAVEDNGQPSAAVHARVVGHQWWWEIAYPDYGIVTANELHVPAAGPKGQSATFLDLRSADVIHSFWIPQLSGKTDLIPNRPNSMWLDPREPGVYLGNCAEFCGTQHANMLIRVIVHPAGEFERWAAEQKEPAAASGSPGEALFASLNCVNCHAVRGTAAEGKFGPDLTHLMSRQIIGSGVLRNTPENLRSWVNDPQEVKEGCLMPSLKLTGAELDQVVSYLQSLH